jgi:O-antigen ligase
MYREKIIDFTENYKPIIWGLFLSTIIFKHIIGSIFLGILITLFFLQFSQKKEIRISKKLLPITIYVLWGISSLLWTTDLSNTIDGIITSLPLIVIPLLISQYSDFKIDDFVKSIKVLSYCLLTYFFISFFYAVLLFLNDKNLGHFFYHDFVSIFENNAIYISLAVAICILIIFNSPHNKAKDYLTITFLSVFLLLLSSKNIIITTLILIFVSIFTNKKHIRKATIVFSIIVALLLFLIFIGNPIKARFLSELNFNAQYILTGQDFYDYNFSGFEIRLFQWRILVEMIINNQVGFLGLGLHNVNYLLDQYFSYYNLYKGYFYINFHNQFLQTLGELGIIGLLILLNVFRVFISKSFLNKNKIEIMFTLLFVIAFLTESYLSRQKGVFLFATLYGLFLKTKNTSFH